jgi:hypothetical protein
VAAQRRLATQNGLPAVKFANVRIERFNAPLRGLTDKSLNVGECLRGIPGERPSLTGFPPRRVVPNLIALVELAIDPVTLSDFAKRGLAGLE